MQNQQVISSNVVSNAIKTIQQKVWEGVAVQNLRKMAPKSAHLEGKYILDTFVNISTENQQKINDLQNQLDPVPAQIDPFSTGVLEGEKSPKKQRTSSFNSSFVTKKTHQSFLQRKAIETLQSQSQMKETKSNYDSFFQLTLDEDKHSVYDPDEERLRNARLQREKQQQETKGMLRERERAQEERYIKNKKLMKDLKKYTYDYEGKVFGLGNIDPGKQKIMKILNRNGQMKLLSKQTKKPEQSMIQNDRIKERDNKAQRNKEANTKNAPMFNQDQPQSLLDTFDDKISEGVKLTTTKGNQNVSKEKTRPKLSGMKKYRRTEFQNITRDKKFKEHKYPGSSATISAPQQVIPLYKKKVEKKERIKTKSQKSLDLNNKTIDGYNNALPPLKDRSLKSSKMFSDRSFDEKGLQSRFSKKRQKVNIDDEELYSVNFSQIR